MKDYRTHFNELQTGLGLNPLGVTIWADRYARRAQGIAPTVGGPVVVKTDTAERQLGFAVNVSADGVDVLLPDGTIGYDLAAVDVLVETTPDDFHLRIAKAIAAAERDEPLASEWADKFLWLLRDWKFVPGGRVLAGAGVDANLVLYNCYVISSPSDTREGIVKTLQEKIDIMSAGGGVGINISTLRPNHSPVRGVNGRSSGSVSWGGLYSFTTGLVQQAGSRRGALMLILNVWHPDILEFINSKRTAGQITNANISVGITDDFMDAVEHDRKWSLVFPETSHPAYDSEWDGDIQKWKAKNYPVKIYETLPARNIWDAIIGSAWASAEPGVYFVDRANQMSNSWYYAPLNCTNPCGEEPLPDYGVCNLGAINLPRFHKNGVVNWADLGKAVRYAVRFLDDVIDVTPYLTEANRTQQLSERRVGLGTMGLSELLIRMGLRYGSDESLQFVDKLYKFIATEAYLASIGLAEQKGDFPAFDRSKFLASGFMQGMPDEVRSGVMTGGIRNVTLLTQAPTGSTGTMVGTSTGIEPYYFWSYNRKSRLGTHEERVGVYDDYLAEHGGDAELPDYFVTAMDLPPSAHVKMQAAIQRWVDSAISKTANLPSDYTIDQTRELYELMYDLGCKGGTVYRDGSRDEQVLNLKADDDTKSSAPPTSPAPDIKSRIRPTVLTGTTYRKHTPIGTAYITINANGSGGKEPFEVFINVAKVGSDVAADAEGLGRLISLILRMPSPLSPNERARDIIAQLRGIGSGRQQGFGPNRVMSLPDAVAQAIAEHIGFSPNGELPGLPDEEDGEPHQLSFTAPQGDICPTCGNATLLMIEGCKKCHACGYSEC